MAVGSALAGRQARRRAGELADEQASPSDANYCIAHLRELMQHWDRKRRALRSATRMGGGETSMCVCVCGGGSCKREEKQKDGGWRGDEREETREGHVQRGGGSVTLQLLMQEKKNPPCISPPSVSAVENNSAAPVKRGEDRGILGVPQKPDGSHGDWGSSRLLPSCSDYCCQSLRSTMHHSPVYISAKNLRPFFENIFQNSKSLFYSYLAGKRKHKLKQANMRAGR